MAQLIEELPEETKFAYYDPYYQETYEAYRIGRSFAVRKIQEPMLLSIDEDTEVLCDMAVVELVTGCFSYIPVPAKFACFFADELAINFDDLVNLSELDDALIATEEWSAHCVKTGEMISYRHWKRRKDAQVEESEGLS